MHTSANPMSRACAYMYNNDTLVIIVNNNNGNSTATTIFHNNHVVHPINPKSSPVVYINHPQVTTWGGPGRKGLDGGQHPDSGSARFFRRESHGAIANAWRNHSKHLEIEAIVLHSKLRIMWETKIKWVFGVLSIIKYLKWKLMALGLPHDMIGELRADRSRGLWWGLRHIWRSSERIDFRPATCRPGMVWLTGWLVILLEASWVRKTWYPIWYVFCCGKLLIFRDLPIFQDSQKKIQSIPHLHGFFVWISWDFQFSSHIHLRFGSWGCYLTGDGRMALEITGFLLAGDHTFWVKFILGVFLGSKITHG